MPDSQFNIYIFIAIIICFVIYLCEPAILPFLLVRTAAVEYGSP